MKGRARWGYLDQLHDLSQDKKRFYARVEQGYIISIALIWEEAADVEVRG